MAKNTHLLEEMFFSKLCPSSYKTSSVVYCGQSQPKQTGLPPPLTISHFLELWDEPKGTLVVRGFTIPMGLLKIKDRKEVKGVPW